MIKIKNNQKVTIQTWIVDEDESTEGLYAFTEGEKPKIYGPAVYVEVDGDTVTLYQDDDVFIPGKAAK